MKEYIWLDLRACTIEISQKLGFVKKQMHTHAFPYTNTCEIEIGIPNLIHQNNDHNRKSISISVHGGGGHFASSLVPVRLTIFILL